jgi:N-acetylmuramoyl-L-alanine amidase
LFSDTAVFKQVEHKSFNGKTRVELEFTKAVDYTAEFKDGKFSVTVSNSELKSKLKPYKVRDGIIEAISIDEGKSAGKPFVNFEFELPYYYRHEIMSCTPSKTIEIELYETPLKDMLIVVDPGHGGDAPGAIGSTGVKEKDLALDIAQRLNKLLISGGAETHMVRDSDISVPYQIRHNIANELNADIFVSIHINAYNNNKINGVETLYCPSDTKDSLKLAEAVHKAMLDRLDLADRGIFKRTDIVVLRETSMPAVMAEIGYITNPEDEKKLMNPEFRQQAAQALYNGLIEYLSR